MAGTAASVPEQAVAVRRGSRGLALGVLCTLLFLTFLDNTIVSVGLGSVQGDLHAGVADLQWVVSAYALTFASTMLAFGMIADEFGRKRVMLAGAAVFCAGSVLSALAPTAPVLIAGRAVMGLGAAASEPGTLSMLRHLYPAGRERARAVGVWSGVAGLALALGPVIGGILVGAWDWRGIFWFNLAFGLAALAVAALVLPESADPQAHRVDVAGTVLGAGALAAFVFAVITGENAGFGSAAVIALFCASAAGAAGFVWQEHRAAHPLLDLRFLRVPQFAVPNVVAFCSYFATFAIFFFTALYLNEVAGYSGYQIAVVFLPMMVLMISASLLAGRWAVTGLRISIVAGCLVSGPACWSPTPRSARIPGIWRWPRRWPSPEPASAPRPCPSPQRCWLPSRRNAPAWPHRPPTRAGRSARSPGSRFSGRWSTRSCGPASPAGCTSWASRRTSSRS